MRLIELKSFFLTHFKLFLYAMANPFRLLIFFIWVLTNTVSAQTVFADYKDGCLYVKTQKQLQSQLAASSPTPAASSSARPRGAPALPTLPQLRAPLNDLALALFVGMLVGTYSSIFTATPILTQIKERQPEMRSLRKRGLNLRHVQSECLIDDVLDTFHSYVYFINLNLRRKYDSRASLSNRIVLLCFIELLSPKTSNVEWV